MDLAAIILLILEALFALWLLRREGLLDHPRALIVSLLLTAAALGLRACCLDYETLDYQNFLRPWVAFYRNNLGFRSLAYPLGNYNIPYLYFLCFFSYLPVRDLYLIKLLSIFFDVLLAFGAMKLLGLCTENRRMRIVCFFTVLFLPTVVLNGALWGQCDSIYVALALLGLWLGLTDRPVLSVLCFALSFGFKLQAVFILPIMAVLWFRGNYKLRHFALFPAFYVLLVLPAVLLGKPFLDTITLYASQTGSIGSGLNYNSPSVFSVFTDIRNPAAAATVGICLAAFYMLNLLAVSWVYRDRMNDKAILALCLLFAIGIPFFLPHMHERYFYAADIFSLVLAFAVPLCFPVALLVQFASLLGYHAYLKMRYLLLMNHGAAALIAAFALTLLCFIGAIREGLPKRRRKKAAS